MATTDPASYYYTLNWMFTYVRTEVNYTEEVDDPVDSDGEHGNPIVALPLPLPSPLLIRWACTIS